jgi:hypothetical protein
MGLIKNYKFVIHKDKDMNFSMVCWRCNLIYI